MCCCVIETLSVPPWKSSVIFRKCPKNVRKSSFGTILENLLKFSESGRKSLENRQKRRHEHVYIEVKPWSQDWLIAAGAYQGFCSVKRLEVFLLPLDGMLVHRRSFPSIF